jgi:hypothetical protein
VIASVAVNRVAVDLEQLVIACRVRVYLGVRFPDVRPSNILGRVGIPRISYSSVSIVVLFLCRRGSPPLGIGGALSPSLWSIVGGGVVAAVGVCRLLAEGRVDGDVELGALLSVFGRLPETECTTGSLRGRSSRGIGGGGS